MLPRETTLSIRVIAPLKIRAHRLSERMGVSVRTARRAARDLDRRRLQFDRTMHRANSNDPHNYDMVLDSHSLGVEIAAEIVVRAVEAGRRNSTAMGPLLRNTSERGTLNTELFNSPQDLSVVARASSIRPTDVSRPPGDLATEAKPREATPGT